MKNLTGKRAFDRELVKYITSRGERRRIRERNALVAKAARARKTAERTKPNPTYRSPVRVKVKRARRLFVPGSVGHLNARMVGANRVARTIAEMGPQAACAQGYGDKKKRRLLNDNGLAATTTLTASWRVYWNSYTTEGRAQAEAAQAAVEARKSANPFKRGFQWIKDRTRGE